jgi:glycosyltransferase involved in cell wall biosynthesis
MAAGANPLIIVLTPGFPANESDTTCLPFVQQVVQQIAVIRGHRSVKVISFQYPFVSSNYVWKGIEVHPLGGRNRSGLMRTWVWFRAISLVIRFRIRQPVSGLLCFWLTECAFAGRLAASLSRLPLFVWLQGQDAREGNPYARMVKPAGRELIAISQSQKQLFTSNYKTEPHHVAGNGIDPSAFPPLNTGARNVDILGVGSLVAVKNFRLFIEVINEIRRIFPMVKAEIIGDGELRREIQQMIETWDMGANIVLRGQMSHPEVLQRMNESKILIHTSCFEGNSGVILEALYSGCQVLSTVPPDAKKFPGSFHRCSGLTEFVLVAGRLLSSELVFNRSLINTVRQSAEKVSALFV